MICVRRKVKIGFRAHHGGETSEKKGGRKGGKEGDEITIRARKNENTALSSIIRDIYRNDDRKRIRSIGQ